jgi:hypothetical protein
MRRVLLLFVAFITVVAFAQNMPQTGTVQVELLNTIKTKKAKVGDEVKARTVTPLIVEHGTVIPVGSTVIGRVLAAEADAPDTHESFVKLVFNQVNLQHAKPLSLNLSVRAALKPEAPSQAQQRQQAPENSPPAGQAQPDMQILHGGPLTPHNTPESLKTMPRNGQNPGVAAHTGSVIGMPNVVLETGEEKDAASTFRSSRKDLQLDSGLQLILKVVP